MTGLRPWEATPPAAHQPAGNRRTSDALPRWTVTGVVVGLLGLAGLAWWLTVRRSGSMDDMATGLGQVGTGMPADTSAALFLAMWLTMMVAMMFPTVAPMVLAHRVVVARRGEGAAPTLAFVSGYLLAWTATGIVPLAALVGFRGLSADAAHSRWLPTLAGAILLVAGAYQFTRWKAVCLRACRSPLWFAFTHDFGGGCRSALRAGVTHGAYCLGCCWALMSVLLVVGLMNLAWMATLALIFLAEKTWRHGAGLSRAVGTATIALGVAVLAYPSLLPGLAAV